MAAGDSSADDTGTVAGADDTGTVTGDIATPSLLGSVEKNHRHASAMRGKKVVAHPAPDNEFYQPVNYTYANQTGNIHEVVEISGRQLAKIGYPDRKIVYYLLDDLEILS